MSGPLGLGHSFAVCFQDGTISSVTFTFGKGKVFQGCVYVGLGADSWRGLETERETEAETNTKRQKRSDRDRAINGDRGSDGDGQTGSPPPDTPWPTVDEGGPCPDPQTLVGSCAATYDCGRVRSALELTETRGNCPCH